jgi:hypothetical protein
MELLKLFISNVLCRLKEIRDFREAEYLPSCVGYVEPEMGFRARLHRTRTATRKE